MSAYVEDETRTGTEINLEGELVVDLSDVSLEPFEDGWHTIHITKVTLKKSGPDSKTPGTPMMSVGGEAIGEDDSDKGRYLFWNLMLAGKGKQMGGGFFASVGIAVGESHKYTRAQQLIDAVLDRYVDVRTRRKEDGEYGLRAEVKEYRTACVGGSLGLTIE
jgi:hypothetical protein